MAKCGFCEQEMRDAESCTKNAIGFPNDLNDGAFDGQYTAAIPYGEEDSPVAENNERCPDCGVKHGGFHHAGCDIEQTPLHEKLDLNSQLLAVVLKMPPEYAPMHAHVQTDPHTDISMDDVLEQQKQRGGD